jgi:hypothetical protein
MGFLARIFFRCGRDLIISEGIKQIKRPMNTAITCEATCGSGRNLRIYFLSQPRRKMPLRKNAA